MSFGNSVGDVASVATFCWKVYKKCKHSGGEFKDCAVDLSSLHSVLKETEEILSLEGLNNDQQTKLKLLKDVALDSLNDLEKRLEEHESLSTRLKRDSEKMRWELQGSVAELRQKLVSQTTILDEFNNSVLHAWLKYKLNQLIYDIRAGKYPGFVLSSQTFDGNDQENWEQLCKELEKIGISENVIRERREFIIAWFEGAIEDRRLDEDKPDLVGEGKLDPAGEDIGGMEEKSWKGPKSTQPATRLYERTSSQTQATPAPRERNSRSWLSYRLFALKSDLHYALKPDELLINAAREGDATKVEELLKRGANVNYHTTKKCSKGQTPLHQALVGVHEAVARLLMEKGADVKAADDQEQTVFHLAALHSNRAMVGLLVDKGIHIEARNERGRTALHLAVALGSKDVVQLLVDQGAEIEARDNLGGTVLHRAAEWGREAIILLLVDKGANIDARDKDGRTPLCTAAMNAKLNAVQLLLDKGADIEARDDHGLTALHSAASHVAEKEADIEESHNDGPMSGYTAAKRARTAIVQLLVDKGADVEAKTDSGEKALNIAASRGHYAIVRILDSK